MKFEFIYDPIPVIIVRDVFTDQDNKDIFDEAIKNKKYFKDAVTGNGVVSEFRTNKVAYYDNIYNEDRSFSKLLTKIDDLFQDKVFQETVASSPYPMHNFQHSNFHETQVSRYGNDGQLYNYHIDAFANNSREITMVYYFNTDPKEFTGGEITLTRSPISNGKLMDESQETITITPENNMIVIFGSKIAHSVKPTKSPKDFSKGRFSVNIWIGRR